MCIHKIWLQLHRRGRLDVGKKIYLRYIGRLYKHLYENRVSRFYCLYEVNHIFILIYIRSVLMGYCAKDHFLLERMLQKNCVKGLKGIFSLNSNPFWSRLPCQNCILPLFYTKLWIHVWCGHILTSTRLDIFIKCSIENSSNCRSQQLLSYVDRITQRWVRLFDKDFEVKIITCGAFISLTFFFDDYILENFDISKIWLMESPTSDFTKRCVQFIWQSVFLYWLKYKLNYKTIRNGCQSWNV